VAVSCCSPIISFFSTPSRPEVLRPYVSTMSPVPTLVSCHVCPGPIRLSMRHASVPGGFVSRRTSSGWCLVLTGSLDACSFVVMVGMAWSGVAQARQADRGPLRPMVADSLIWRAPA
jgi:hypothetical protein